MRANSSWSEQVCSTIDRTTRVLVLNVPIVAPPMSISTILMSNVLDSARSGSVQVVVKVGSVCGWRFEQSIVWNFRVRSATCSGPDGFARIIAGRSLGSAPL